MSFFNIHNVFFEFLGASVSYLEFFGVISGLWAVWLSARANTLNWPLGMVSVALLFFLFYQVQLYPDMFLQLFFFITNLIGWWRWTHPQPGEEDRKKELKVSYMSRKEYFVTGIAGCVGTILFGAMAGRLHEWLPMVFSIPSAYPYLDSFITVFSVMTTFLIIQKKIESWIFWIIIDLVATVLYFVRDIQFVSLEYLLLCVIAAFGFFRWMKEHRSYPAAA